MNEFVVDYKSRNEKMLMLTLGGYFLLYGIYHFVKLVLANTFNLDFYLALIVIVAASVCVLRATLWAPKPLLRINQESLYVNMQGSKVYLAQWIDVREIAIGVSYLNIFETDGKKYFVDMSGLKYSDLKEAKAQIIEICESKKIAYRND